MASMRCTDGNPMNFTMEYMEEQMISVANANGLLTLQGVITVLEMTEVYLPQTNEVSF
jgi:hypothetical protein